MNRGVEKLRRFLDRALAYCAKFGILAGLRVLASVGVARLLRLDFVDITAPALPSAIRVRPRSSDVAVFTQTFVREEYDLSSMLQARSTGLLDSLPDGVVIVDCGANIGISTVWFAAKFPNATIIAIEPEGDNYALLCHNVRNLPQVTSVQAGVWNTKTDLVISNPTAEKWAFRTIESRESLAPNGETKISTVTINDFIPDDRRRRFLVKVDVEGAEGTIFKSGLDWLDRVDVLVIELHDYLRPWERTSHAFLKAISERNFDVLWRGENIFCFRYPSHAIAAAHVSV